jgi:hypothetical protein
MKALLCIVSGRRSTEILNDQAKDHQRDTNHTQNPSSLLPCQRPQDPGGGRPCNLSLAKQKEWKVKAKTNKQKSKFSSTADLAGALRVLANDFIIETENMTYDDRLVTSDIMVQSADRIIALVNLTSQQNKRIKELDAVLRKVSK